MIKRINKKQQIKNAIYQIKCDSTITLDKKAILINYIINNKNKINLLTTHIDDLKNQLL